MQCIIVYCSHHTAYYILMIYLFYNWKFVPFDPLHSFHLTPPHPTPASGNHQSVLCICVVTLISSRDIHQAMGMRDLVSYYKFPKIFLKYVKVMKILKYSFSIQVTKTKPKKEKRIQIEKHETENLPLPKIIIMMQASLALINVEQNIKGKRNNTYTPRCQGDVIFPKGSVMILRDQKQL